MEKQYIAIYDEHKLIGGMIHNFLERNYEYQILFNSSSEELLYKYLGKEVKLLLFHADEATEKTIEIIKRVLRKFEHLKILIYTRNEDVFRQQLNNNKVVIFSTLIDSVDFLKTIEQILPEHPNHKRKEDKKQYNLTGFDKIKQNRKFILIIKYIADGLKPKEMEKIVGLKWNTINSYIEQMQKETGCGNQTELFLQAKERGIL